MHQVMCKYSTLSGLARPTRSKEEAGLAGAISCTTLPPPFAVFPLQLTFCVDLFRVQAGECYHLFTRFHHDRLKDFLLPEILRTRLEELCLQIKLLKLGSILPFLEKAMQTPSLEAVQRSIELLHKIVRF